MYGLQHPISQWYDLPFYKEQVEFGFSHDSLVMSTC